MVEEEKSVWVEKFPVLELSWLNDSYFKLRLLAPQIAETAVAGQFVNVRVTDTLDPLLRRPLSIARRNADDGWIELVVKAVGRGTRFLGEAKPGQLLDVLGPLGHGFDVNGVEEAVLVGGGIGVAPLLFLADEFAELDTKFVFVQGFRNQAEVCCLDDLKGVGGEFILTTDDGSAGRQGLVTEQVQKVLDNWPRKGRPTIFGCGPQVMLKSLAKIVDRFELDWQFSLETRMACGMGACVGCAIPTFDGEHYRLVCKDGPVFKKHEVLL